MGKQFFVCFTWCFTLIKQCFTSVSHASPTSETQLMYFCNILQTVVFVRCLVAPYSLVFVIRSCFCTDLVRQVQTSLVFVIRSCSVRILKITNQNKYLIWCVSTVSTVLCELCPLSASKNWKPMVSIPLKRYINSHLLFVFVQYMICC